MIYIWNKRLMGLGCFWSISVLSKTLVVLWPSVSMWSNSLCFPYHKGAFCGIRQAIYFWDLTSVYFPFGPSFFFFPNHVSDFHGLSTHNGREWFCWVAQVLSHAWSWSFLTPVNAVGGCQNSSVCQTDLYQSNILRDRKQKGNYKYCTLKLEE